MQKLSKVPYNAFKDKEVVAELDKSKERCEEK